MRTSIHNWRSLEETARLHYAIGGAEVADVYLRAAEAEEALETLEGQLEKRFEVQLEQSEFRADLLEEILELCKRPGPKAELVKAIKAAFENSYVEL